MLKLVINSIVSVCSSLCFEKIIYFKNSRNNKFGFGNFSRKYNTQDDTSQSQRISNAQEESIVE